MYHSKSPPPDKIPHGFIHEFGKITKQYLLNIYNHIWKNGCIPTEWKKGNIIPISKSGKDKYFVEEHRPTALLNTLAKILEKIVNTCLIWFLEKTKTLTDKQNGFRKHRSIIDNFRIINSKIKKIFDMKQYLDLTSMDISKAYDSV